MISRGYLPVTPTAKPPSGSGSNPAGSRGYKTYNAGLALRAHSATGSTSFLNGNTKAQKRGYASVMHEGRLPSSSSDASAFPVITPATKKLGLIGARGYTGQALVKLLNGHPYINLEKVSSRALVGKNLAGYDKVVGGLK